jgi:hypothetical protein
MAASSPTRPWTGPPSMMSLLGCRCASSVRVRAGNIIRAGYWSSTLGRLVVDESRLKLARIMLADFDPSSVTPGGTGRVVLCPLFSRYSSIRTRPPPARTPN